MKVLILAYDFPPFVSVGGLRPYAWLRYLGRHGVEPVVVTRQWANRYGDERDYVAPGDTDDVVVERTGCGTVLRAPYRPNLAGRLLLAGRHPRLRRAVTAGYEVAQFHAHVGTKVELYRAARRWLAANGADAIVATGEPFVLFRWAAELSREFGIPWVADYRDPWSQNRRGPWRGPFRVWERAIERRVTATAALITAVSEPARDVLARLHPDRRIEVVANGYDPEAVGAAAGIPQTPERLTIGFTGTVSPWHPIESVLAVLRDVLAARPDPPLSLRMVGVPGREALEQTIRSRFTELVPHVSFTPRLSNAEAVRELARSNALLLFNNYLYPGTKVYDYLALGRRILLCYTDDPGARALRERHYNVEVPPGADERYLERVLEETRSGVAVKDPLHLRATLEDMQDELSRTGRVDCPSEGVERYSRARQAERMAELLKDVVG